MGSKVLEQGSKRLIASVSLVTWGWGMGHMVGNPVSSWDFVCGVMGKPLEDLSGDGVGMPLKSQHAHHQLFFEIFTL